jgi:hypothetical protein
VVELTGKDTPMKETRRSGDFKCNESVYERGRWRERERAQKEGRGI